MRKKGKGRGGKKEKRTKARVGTVVRTGKRGVEKRRAKRVAREWKREERGKKEGRKRKSVKK